MNIIQIGNPILRKKSEEIRSEEITSKETKKIIREMAEALRRQPQGIGLSAIQIGIPKTIFIVSNYAFNPKSLDEKENEEMIKEKKKKETYSIFINPRILKQSKKQKILYEGCLSVAETFGKIKRRTNVTLEAFDENGVKFRRGAGGLLAQIIQHEMDHLKGELFTDKIIKEPKKINGPR
jgi:peptide deformylase